VAIDINDNVLKELINKVNNNNPIVICGSVFGGTGAGGVPTIANYLRNRFHDVPIIILDFVKWFELPRERDDEDKRLQCNSESGMFYFKDEIVGKVIDLNGEKVDKVNSCVLFGLKSLESDINYEEVGKQNEKKHFINLIAAVVANNSFHCSLDNLHGRNGLFPNKNAFYGYLIPAKGLNPSGLDVYLPSPDGNAKKATMDNIIKTAKAIERFLRFFENYINGGPPRLSFAPGLVLPKTLRMAINYMLDRKKCYEYFKRKTEQKRNDLKDWIEWYSELTRPGEFIIEQIEIESEDYNKAKRCPMSFLSRCINNIDVNEWKDKTKGKTDEEKAEEFVDQIIIQFRQEINIEFFRNT